MKFFNKRIIGLILIIIGVLFLIASIYKVTNNKYALLKEREVKYSREVTQAILDKASNKYGYLDGAYQNLINGWEKLYKDNHNEIIKMRIISGVYFMLFIAMLTGGLCLILIKKKSKNKTKLPNDLDFITNGDFHNIFEINYLDYEFNNQPVRIEKIEVVADNDSSKKAVLFELSNISKEIIDNVSLSVAVYDVTGLKIESYDELVLAQLDVKPNNSFGKEKAIPINDDRIAKVELSVKRVAMKSGKEWINEGCSILKMDSVKSIDFEDNLYQQLIREANNNGIVLNNKYDEYDKSWRCSCGHINNKDSDHCYYCGANNELLKQLFSEEYLAIKLEEYITSEKNKKYDCANKLIRSNKLKNIYKAKELLSELSDWQDSEELLKKCEEKIVLLKDDNNKKRKIKQKRIAIIASVVIILILAFIGVRFAISNSTISKAKSYYSKKQYSKAINTLDKSFVQSDSVISLKNKYIVAYGKKLINDNDKKSFDKLITKYNYKKLYDIAFDYSVKLYNSGDYGKAFSIMKTSVSNKETKGKVLNNKEYKKFDISNISDAKFNSWLEEMMLKEYESKNYNQSLSLAKYLKDDTYEYASYILNTKDPLGNIVFDYINGKTVTRDSCELISKYSVNNVRDDDKTMLYSNECLGIKTDDTILSDSSETYRGNWRLNIWYNGACANKVDLTNYTELQDKYRNIKKEPNNADSNKVLKLMLKKTNTKRSKVKMKVQKFDKGIIYKYFIYTWKKKGKHFKVEIDYMKWSNQKHWIKQYEGVEVK